MSSPAADRRDSERAARPWGDRPSIFASLEAAGREGPPTLVPPELPDEELVSRSGARWVAGGLDGVGTHHVARGEDDTEAQALFEHVRAALRDVRGEPFARLHDAATKTRVVGLAGDLVRWARAAHDGEGLGEPLARLGRRLVAESADREPVKLGLVLLGVAGDARDRAALERLARHDEFTLFAVFALLSLGLADERALWHVAKDVHGWGRIHLVERLAPHPGPEVAAWLLRDGFRTTVMDEYLALACAEGGGLMRALEADAIDGALLEGAGGILFALLGTTLGGPATGLEGYADGVATARGYLRHARGHVETFGPLRTAARLLRFVEGTELDWDALAPLGWTPDVRTEVADAARAVVEDPAWPARVRDALASSDDARFDEGAAAAADLGLDAWDAHFARLLCAPPLADARWWSVCHDADAARMDRVVALAQARLPLDAIASGPAEENSFGPAHAPHRALGWLLQELRRFPGRGFALLRAGLRSPVTHNRGAALAALAAWDRAAWPAELGPLLERALADEPNAEVRAQLDGLLGGGAAN